MLGILLEASSKMTTQLEEADYLVINTCGFLEASRNESKETIEDVLGRGRTELESSLAAWSKPTIKSFSKNFPASITF